MIIYIYIYVYFIFSSIHCISLIFPLDLLTVIVRKYITCVCSVYNLCELCVRVTSGVNTAFFSAYCA